MPIHRVHPRCQGKTCNYGMVVHCGMPAMHQVKEGTRTFDSPEPLTTYLCCFHFRCVMGAEAPCYPEDQK